MLSPPTCRFPPGGGWLSFPSLTAGRVGVIPGEQFQQLMTPEEKNKLYEAIGYQENAADPTLPTEVRFRYK